VKSHGLLKGSFIPEKHVCKWLELTELRRGYTRSLTDCKRRVHRLFKTANTKKVTWWSRICLGPAVNCLIDQGLAPNMARSAPGVSSFLNCHAWGWGSKVD